MTKTKTLTLIFASAALTAAIGLPAWSALHEASAGERVTPLSSLLDSATSARPMILADSDEQDDEDEGASTGRRTSDDDEDSCEEDEGNCGSAAPAPAPAGSVTPPQNGLFGTAPAQVQVK